MQISCFYRHPTSEWIELKDSEAVSGGANVVIVVVFVFVFVFVSLFFMSLSITVYVQLFGKSKLFAFWIDRCSLSKS